MSLLSGRDAGQPKRTLSEELRWTAKRGFKKIGLDVALLRPPLEDRRRQQLIASAGVGLVLDGGANVGQYARRLRAAGYRGRIVSFEPLSTAFSALRAAAEADALWDCHRLALGTDDASVVLNVSANAWSSSLLPITDLHVHAAPGAAYTISETVQSARLDSLVERLRLGGHSTLLKLDVQGAEMSALCGARSFLPEVRLLEVELSVEPLYEGQPPYRVVLAFLDHEGYELAAVREEFVDPGSGRLLQFNAILERQRGTGAPWTRAR